MESVIVMLMIGDSGHVKRHRMVLVVYDVIVFFTFYLFFSRIFLFRDFLLKKQKEKKKLSLISAIKYFYHYGIADFTRSWQTEISAAKIPADKNWLVCFSGGGD